METKEHLQAYLDRLSKKYDAVIAKHGYGVRPSHVSADLAHISYRMETTYQKLAALELEE